MKRENNQRKFGRNFQVTEGREEMSIRKLKRRDVS